MNMHVVKVKPALKLEDGKSYRSASGAIYRVEANDNDSWPFKTVDEDLSVSRFWKEDGAAYNKDAWNINAEIGDDLVSEVVKIKTGDRVRFRSDYNSSARGKSAVVIDVTNWGIQVQLDGEAGARGVSTESPSDLILISTPSHAIVCLIRDGQPVPATRPHVHANRAIAEKEAARLAGVSPGDEFGVYELVATEKVEKSYGHEWQRLAAKGEKVAAIKALRTLAGVSLKSAKDAVEYWMSVEAA